MEHHTYSLTIGISAHNESLNIQHVLQMLLSQTASFYHLEQIIVMCDGCTDDTEEKALAVAVKHPLISVINDHKRFGKPERLNQIYRLNISDILITIDADVTLGNQYVIDELVRHFDDPGVGLVSTNNRPFSAGTLTEKMLNTWEELWYEIRKDVNGGDNIHNVHGACLAMRKSVVEGLTYPAGTIANAQYAYLWVKSKGLGYYFAKEATLFYYSPDNLKDYLIQKGRYGDNKVRNEEEFGREIDCWYRIPQAKKYTAIIKMFFHRPLLVSFAFLFHVWLRKFVRTRSSVQKEGIWQIASSSKRALRNPVLGRI